MDADHRPHMILVLWFYISRLVILVGSEMNAEIPHASPYGKEAGPKTLVGRVLSDPAGRSGRSA